MATVIVYGPQGSGKTRYAEVLRLYFNSGQVIDDWDSTLCLTTNALHLTNDSAVDGLSSFRAPFTKHSVPVIRLTKSLINRAWLGENMRGVAPRLKETNPKDSVGVRKWRQFTTVPLTVLAELGTAMLEGARKYGRHNYRVAGVRASVYVDAAIGHIAQWWEGEDVDADSNLSHITKAIASLVVLRDAMLQDMLTDDRPPKAKLDAVRNDLQKVVDAMFERYPEAVAAYTEQGEQDKTTITGGIIRNRPVK